MYAQQHNKTEQDQFHKVVLHGKTLAFITTAIVVTTVEIESSSTLHFSWNLSRNRSSKKFHETDLLHGATPAELVS